MNFPPRVETVLLAGGSLEEMPPGENRPPGKGLIPVGGIPLAARTLRALSEAHRVGRIILVSPVSAERLASGIWSEADEVVPAGNLLMDSLRSGFSRVRDRDAPALCAAGDLPFLSREAVDEFVERCSRRPEASIWYGYLRREISERAYPGLPHTWARLAEGWYCGTGLVMLRPRVLETLAGLFRQLTRRRKNPLGLASLFGWKTLLDYLTGRLTVARAEEVARRLTGLTCAGIESSFPETAFNVDGRVTLQEARRRAGQGSP